MTALLFVFLIARIMYTSARNAILLNNSEGVAPGWILVEETVDTLEVRHLPNHASSEEIEIQVFQKEKENQRRRYSYRYFQDYSNHVR
nr:unnamed protein product [Callosobruchus chinensis]